MSALDTAHDNHESQHELFHRLQNLDDLIHVSEDAEDKHHRLAERRRIPPLPDLRFEYSYLRGVRQYVTVERPPAAGTRSSAKGKEKEGEAAVEAERPGEGRGEVVHVQWGPILWITTRDQVISPLVQGALWGVASHFLRPLGAALGAQIRTWWARGASRGKGAPEGNGVQWLRNWLGSILTPTSTTSSTFHVR